MKNMHGVDILIPDFLILEKSKKNCWNYHYSHGHEDHIGAMPYLFKEMQFPVYGTSLPLEMIGSKFDEHKMKEHRNYFRAIQKELLFKLVNLK